MEDDRREQTAGAAEVDALSDALELDGGAADRPMDIADCRIELEY
jgi:hypothetical protein